MTKKATLERLADLFIALICLLALQAVDCEPTVVDDDASCQDQVCRVSVSTSDSDQVRLTPTFQWIPEAEHPCTIERIRQEEFLKRFGPQGLPPLFPTPIIILADQIPNADDHSQQDHEISDHRRILARGLYRNQRFQNRTRRDAILDAFPPNFHVTLSSSNSFSEHRRTIPLAQYLEDLHPDTTPDQRSNETWYLFGETFTKEWQGLLDDYEVPACEACVDRDMVALSFGIGNRGSGVQWHVHGPGFAETVWGRKHWILYQSKPNFHPDQTSLNWMEYTYTQLEESDRPLECTLFPGDILYFPNMWYHATINLDPYTAFVSTFTQEHLFVD